MYEPDSTAERILTEIRDDNRDVVPIKSLYDSRPESNRVHHRIDRLEESNYIETKKTDGIKYAELQQKAEIYLRNEDLEARIEELERRVDNHEQAFEDKILPTLQDFHKEIGQLYDHINRS